MEHPSSRIESPYNGFSATKKIRYVFPGTDVPRKIAPLNLSASRGDVIVTSPIVEALGQVIGLSVCILIWSSAQPSRPFATEGFIEIPAEA